MHTERLHSAKEAGERLRWGQCVAIPTETVFGLAADATSDRAIARIFAAKGRPSDNPLIVHLANLEQWEQAARTLPDLARTLLTAFAPGPLTVVVPKAATISPLATAGLDTVGIRIPGCPIARRVLEEASLPLAAPSANRSGRPSSTTWQAVLEDLEGKIDGVLCQNSSQIGLESTVVDCCGSFPILLRPGAVTLKDLQQYYPDARTSGEAAAQVIAGSPGMRHPHYQPLARIVLWEASPNLPTGTAKVAELVHSSSLASSHRRAYCGLEPAEGCHAWQLVRVFPSLEAYASGFYEFLREADRLGIECIAMQLAPAEELGIALRDRQLRAAERKASSPS